MTQIALGTAAGVIAASRMSRSGLLLTVGLVCLLCKRSSRPPMLMQRENANEVMLPVGVTESSAAAALPEIADVSQSSAIAESWPTAPVTSAWDDLRAALTPVLSPMVPPVPSSVVIPALEESPIGTHQDEGRQGTFLPQPPPMVEMFLCEPSFPMVPVNVKEGADLPDQIDLPDPVETAAEPTFLLEPIVTPQPSGGGVPVVVARAEVPLKSATPDTDEEADSGSLSAPRVVPREVQARKSFFDWLRG